jgi:pimeloyl-ACP methyl ester carboxylesterase
VATFCLIHGNWHDGSSWAPLILALRARGHEALAPDMPFDRPGLTYRDRARPALDALIDAEPPVVVVGHSVGSAEAGLVASERDVDLLVYLCPRLGEFPAPPEAPGMFRGGFPFPSRREDGTMVWEPQSAIAAMYPRLDAQTAAALAERLRPGASPTGEYPLSAPPAIPTALVYTTDDEFFTPESERFAARQLLHVDPIELAGGHFPMLEEPERLAYLLDQLTADSTDSRIH